MLRHSPEPPARAPERPDAPAVAAAPAPLPAPAPSERAKEPSDHSIDAAQLPRLPPPAMDSANIEAFFMALEFWFAASGVSAAQDSRRYNFVMAQVPPRTLLELKPKIDAAPTSGRYEFARALLTEHFSELQQRRMQRVLSEMALGDQRPSQLYAEMRRVANDAISEQLLLDLWAARLPPTVQQLIGANQGPTSEKTAIADAVMESQRWRPINAIAPAPGTSQPELSSQMQTVLKDLEKEVSHLGLQIGKLVDWTANVEDLLGKIALCCPQCGTRQRYHADFDEDAGATRTVRSDDPTSANAAPTYDDPSRRGQRRRPQPSRPSTTMTPADAASDNATSTDRPSFDNAADEAHNRVPQRTSTKTTQSGRHVWFPSRYLQTVVYA